MPSLPDVTQEFTANVVPFVEAMQLVAEAAGKAESAVEDLQHTIDLLHGKTVEVSVSLGGVSLADLTKGIHLDLDTAGVEAYTEALTAAGVATSSLSRRTTYLRGSEAALVGVIGDVRDALDEQMAVTAAKADEIARLAGTVGVLALAEKALRESTTSAGAGAAAAAAGFRILGTGIRLTGNAIHWIIAGTAEFLAVAVPAAIALGAGMAVAAQGAQMAQIHMSALYTATEATANVFHTTFGQALGLRAALQQAQDAANPAVYAILGSVINDAKVSFGQLATAGLAVVHVFDEFAARVTVDLQGSLGGEVHGLLSNMVTDLVGLGQVAGNVGHAFLNLASAMPGLAEVLLRILDAGSQVLLWLTSMPAAVIAAVMGFEEFWRWGGLLATMIGGLANLLPRLIPLLVAGIGAGFATAGRLMSSFVQLGAGVVGFFANLIGYAARVVPALSGAEGALSGLSAGMTGLAANTGLMTGLGVAIAAVTTLALVLLNAKNATEQWVASSQQAVKSASDLSVFSEISKQAAENSIRLAAAQQEVTSTMHHVVDPGAAANMSDYARRVLDASKGVDALRQNQQFLSSTANNVVANMTNLAAGVNAAGQGMHITAADALLLANAAGVNLQQAMGRGTTAFKIAVQEILNLEQGYRAMGVQSGQVGMDMTAISIQAGLQATKVQQLTQAWDAYIGLLTGGTNTLATFEQGLQNMGNVASSTSGTLFQATGRMSQATNSFALNLRSFTGKGAQDWQNFNQVISTGAQQFVDWMSNAAAVGMVSGPQMSGAIKGIVNQLIPFAAHSAAARAELAGFAAQANYTGGTSLKDLEQWARQGGMSAAQLGRFVNGATVRLSSMAKVAENLGVVLQSQLATSFDSARMKTSGFDSSLSALTNEIASHASPVSLAYKTALSGVITSMHTMGVTVPTITGFLKSLGVNITTAGVQADVTAASNHTLTASLTTLHGVAATEAKSILDHATAMDHMMSSAQTATGKVQSLSTQLQHTGDMARTAGGQVQGYHTQVDTAGSASQSAATRVALAAGSIQHAGNMASTASGQVHSLASAIAGLTSKTITVTTNFVTTGTHRQSGGPVAPGVPYTVGEAGRELFVPAAAGWVLPHPDTERWLHTTPLAGGGGTSSGGGAGGGTMRLEAAIHTHVNVDGQELLSVMQPHVLTYNVRNGNPQSGTMSPLVRA